MDGSRRVGELLERIVAEDLTDRETRILARAILLHRFASFDIDGVPTAAEHAGASRLAESVK
jgi:hypothetical protein